MFVALEYLFSWILSILIGLVLGNLIVAGFKGILAKIGKGSIIYSIVEVKDIYLKVLLWSVVMIIGVVVALVIYMNDRDLSILLKADVVKEKPKINKFCGFFVLAGLCIVVITLLFSMVTDSEEGSMAIGLLVVSTGGLFCCLLFGIGFFMERFKRKHPDQYCKKTLIFNNIYSRLTDNINIVAIQMMIGMAFIYFIWTVSGGIWETEPEKYPYDLVCKAPKSEAEHINEICRQYGNNVDTYPCLDAWFVNVHLLAIPESTSKELWGETFGLKDEEIVYLWGGTEAEWNSLEGAGKERGIAIGWDDRVNNGFENYILEKDQKQMLFGAYLPSVIVFSDQEFQRLYEQGEGCTSITIMNDSHKIIQKAEKELKSLGKDQIEVYGKETMLMAQWMEGIVRFSIVMFGAVTILIFLLFTLCIKFYSDLPSMRKKYLFLNTMGMRKKEKRALIKKEITFVLILPTVIAAVIGSLHCLGFLRCYVKGRGLPFLFASDYHNPSAMWILPQAVVYILIMFLFTVIIRNLMVRWIEKE